MRHRLTTACHVSLRLRVLHHRLSTSVDHYRVYKIGQDGRFISGVDLEQENDEAAIEAAKQFVDGCDVELWQGHRRVIRLERS